MMPLLLVMLRVAAVEVPSLLDPSQDVYRQGVEQLSAIFQEVGAEGKLISPEADPYLLAATGFGESRWRPNSVDGDCHPNGRNGTNCASFGTMQLSKSAPWVLANIDPDNWKGVTLLQLRDPKRNVQAAYRELRYFRETCKKATPELVLSSYMAGKCVTLPMGRARCAVARLMAEKAGVDGITCSTAAAPKKLAAALKKAE